MDHGWIITYGNATAMQVHLSIASEGGSGTPVPDISMEVDDVDAVLSAMRQAEFEIVLAPPTSHGASGASMSAIPRANSSTSCST